MLNHIIRPVQKQDIEQLIKLIFEHASYEGVSIPELNQASRLKTVLLAKNPLVHCYVVLQDGYLVGYTSFMKQYATWLAYHYIYMDCLYLRPESRNRGIGKELMQSVVDYCRKENCQEIQWQTPENNLRAIKFYKNLGAESKSKKRFFYKI